MRKTVSAKKRKKRVRLLRALLLFLLLLLLSTGIFFAARFFRAPLFTPERPPCDSVLGLPISTQLVDEGTKGRPGIKREIRYIVIHETGNFAKGADAKSHASFLCSGNSGTTSWHYTVDDTGVFQHIPDNEIAWHAGDGQKSGGGNACGIGIELCVDEGGDFEKAFQNGAKLAAFLMESYQLDETALTQHADYISKNCPETIRNAGRWDEFKAAVSAYRKELSKT